MRKWLPANSFVAIERRAARLFQVDQIDDEMIWPDM
jgi:hypothetical protein